MKQGIRLLVKPGTFFNQLQWSTHHWFILIAFLMIASIETHVGKSHLSYQVFADVMSARFAISWNEAIWVVTSLKLAFMLAGSFLLASFIWMVGNIFGRRTSKRVLFRRLSVVFTVLLAGYTLEHLSATHPDLGFVAMALYVWGSALGYFALKEQFALNHLETAVLGAFAMLVVVSSWHFANHAMESAAKIQSNELAAVKKPIELKMKTKY